VTPAQTALGISTGDIVRTSYGTGPYVVRAIVGPTFAQDGTPLLDLVLSVPGERSRYDINDVIRIGNGWFSRGGADELYVTPMGGPAQLSLFAAGATR
jgi:hypothetical protein